MSTTTPWTLDDLRAVHNAPLPDLLYRAQTVHREHHDPAAVQRCTLLSIKTGRCPEDCGYCPQSAHYDTGVEAHDLLDVDDVLAAAARAKSAGASRFCMGAAWRNVRDGAQFDRVLEMVRGVRALEMEACVTLGMLTAEQAERLAEAGLTAYNHNLDTGPNFYPKIVSTRTYADRLETLENVAAAGIGVCCGGILGMGESIDDRLEMLLALTALATPPESVPINALVPVEGTPLADRAPVDAIAMARIIATARIALPSSRIRLSAGRLGMSDAEQALCFIAGANSIFSGETLLTTPNPGDNEDERLLATLGMHALSDEERHEYPGEREHDEETAEIGHRR